MPSHTGVRRLALALAGVPLPTVTLDLWRTVEAGRDPLDATASHGYFGRWHDPRVALGLYTAQDRATAISEVLHRYSPGEHVELTVATLDVTIPHLLDLTDPLIASRLPFPPARCVSDTRLSLGRGALVGDAALEIGATALLAPSLRGAARCVCLYADLSGVPLNRITVAHTAVVRLTVP